MTDSSGGYRTDLEYTFGYYPELNPNLARFALLHAGIAAPTVAHACELGFGQGISVNIHAAASGVRWQGTDFNAGQAAYARGLAGATGSGPALSEESFAEFAARGDLPDFDFVALHGIWTWISDENRAVLVDFVRRKLNPGGILYISYNTMPGWAQFVPMRHLMLRHAASVTPPAGGILPQIAEATAFARKLLAAAPGYANANPTVLARLDALKGQDQHYVAHEYFNRYWDPVHYADMAGSLAPAKLRFACSATLLEHVDAAHLTADQQALLKEIADPVLRESVRDFCINQQFRRDYWVKGPRRLSALEQREALEQVQVVLSSPVPEGPLSLTTTLGKVTLDMASYGPVLEALSGHRPKPLGELNRDLADSGMNLAKLVQAVVILAGMGHLAVAQGADTTAAARDRCHRLNEVLMDRSRSSNEAAFLASPVTGGGISVGRIDQMFLLAQGQGRRTPAEQAAYAWELLSAQGQRLTVKGKALDGEAENLPELTRQAESLAAERLPMLQALQVV